MAHNSSFVLESQDLGYSNTSISLKKLPQQKDFVKVNNGLSLPYSVQIGMVKKIIQATVVYNEMIIDYRAKGGIA